MKYSLLKRISAFVLAFALVMTTAFNAVGTTQANAAKKATVSAKGATVTVGASKNIKVSIKCKAKAKATIKVAVVKGATGKVTKKVTNSNAKKAAKTCKSTIKVTGKKAGKVKLSITPYINGKKAGKAKKITVTVKAKATTEAATTAATTAAPATTQASADATTQLPPSVKVESVLLDKSTASVVEGSTVTLTATKTPAAAVAAVTWKSSDTSVATVVASGDSGVVTGVKPGTATITAEADGKTATATITVTKKEIVAALVDAKQASANTVTIAFDITEAPTVVNKNDIKITNASANAVAGINTLEFDKTGKVATATLTGNLANGATYTVEYKGVVKSFVASVGAVASITIETDTAELNTATPVKFKLLDGTGMDVTSTIAVDSRVSITATGTSSESLTPASKATITLGAVGDKAEVTVTYDKGDGKSDLVVGTKTITCIAANAKVGQGIFYVVKGDGTDIDNNSGCAKFYNGLKSDIVKVTAGGPASNTVFFYADASADGAIDYDSYELEAVDADLISATPITSAGKFCSFTVSGYVKGQTYLKIKATKNGATTEYQVPVSVGEYGKIAGLTITGNNKLTNAYDTRYKSAIKATPAFNGDSTAVTYTWKITTDLKDIYGNDLNEADYVTKAGTPTTGGLGEDEVDVSMWGVANASYTLSVTAQDANLNEITRTYTINNDKLDDKFWNSDAGADIKYDLESTNQTYKVSDLGTALPTYKLIAKAGGKFAGYVKSATGEIGTHHPDDSTTTNPSTNFDSFAADGLTPNVKFALTAETVVVSTTGYSNLDMTYPNLAASINHGAVGANANADTNTVTLNPYAAGAVTVDFTDPTACTFVTGAYKVEFKFTVGGSATETVLSKTYNFTNTFAKPDVTPSTKTVKAGSQANVYKTKYDLNNNTPNTVVDALTSLGATVANGEVATKAVLTTNANTGTVDVTYVVPSSGGKITVE